MGKTYLQKMKSSVITQKQTIIGGIALILLSNSLAYAQGLHPERRGLGFSHQYFPQKFLELKALNQPKETYVKTNLSLLINQKSVLKHITLSSVMNKLASESNDHSLKSSEREANKILFERFLKAFTCNEGDQPCENVHPTVRSLENYKAIAVVNRFDLADDKTYKTCGEYRIVFAFFPDQSNPPGREERLLINFEFELPNPSPKQETRGCTPITKFWADLSRHYGSQSLDPGISKQLAMKINSFFLNGIPISATRTLTPVSIKNANKQGKSGRGQIRINWKKPTGAWVLKEFSFEKEQGRLALKQRTVKGVPRPEIFKFSANTTGSQRARIKKDVQNFAKAVANDMENLSKSGLNNFSFEIPEDLLAKENHSSKPDLGDLLYLFNQNSSLNDSLRSAIEGQIEKNNLKPKLATELIVSRINALSCAGCHRYAAGTVYELEADGIKKKRWPHDTEFVHISELYADNDTAYRLSPALKMNFLPHRKEVFECHLGFLEKCSKQNAK
ncbi:MAG: hypothetical protein MI743_21020 [Sneathiellales bacterium]|nr:hypothetical protein [Sneathiellales bacterium]